MHAGRAQSDPTPAPRRSGGGGASARGFTLVEWLVTISIIAIVSSAGALAIRHFRRDGILSQAKIAVLTYSAVARSYARANHIETLLVVNPYNGRFELWHLNPPAGGGPWDPYSDNDGSNPALTDGYAYAPVLDPGAALPLDGHGRPLVAVCPIDYDDTVYRPSASPDPNERKLDNLTWAALCFDENGMLVTRTRRIATRSYRFRSGQLRPISQRNRLEDEAPDLSLLKAGPLVTNADTPITSTRGFVLSDARRIRDVIGTAPSASELVNNWLFETRPGGRYARFAETVVLGRASGRRLAEAP
ncbi:MAG: Tfp pilus assembly protein FimT/FimU [Phycisphaerae bacterium]